MLLEKLPYKRWHPAQPDIAGGFRGGDPAMFESLNARTWASVLSDAYAENDNRMMAAIEKDRQVTAEWQASKPEILGIDTVSSPKA